MAAIGDLSGFTNTNPNYMKMFTIRHKYKGKEVVYANVATAGSAINTPLNKIQDGRYLIILDSYISERY